MVKCSCQYPIHTTKARKYIHIFKTYWRTSSCTAHEFVRRALLTQNGARARAPSNSGWFRIDVNGHKGLSGHKIGSLSSKKV